METLYTKTKYYKPIEPIKKTEINNDTIKVHAYTWYLNSEKQMLSSFFLDSHVLKHNLEPVKTFFLNILPVKTFFLNTFNSYTTIVS